MTCGAKYVFAVICVYLHAYNLYMCMYMYHYTYAQIFNWLFVSGVMIEGMCT